MPYIIRPKFELNSEEERILFWSIALSKRRPLNHKRGRSCVKNNYVRCFTDNRLNKIMDRLHDNKNKLFLLKKVMYAPVNMIV